MHLGHQERVLLQLLDDRFQRSVLKLLLGVSLARCNQARYNPTEFDKAKNKN